MTNLKIYEELEREAETNEQYPPSWNPIKGAKLTGKIFKISVAKSLYSGWVPVILLQDERSGEKHSVWIGHTVLRQWCERQTPQIGDVVFIECLGKNEKGYIEFKCLIHKEKFAWEDHSHRKVERPPSDGNGFKDGALQNNDLPASPCTKDDNRMFYKLRGQSNWICNVCQPVSLADSTSVEWAESSPF